MAGTGRAPKAPDERRNHHSPRRGDWTELPHEVAHPVPRLPPRGAGRGAWAPRTRAAWRSWWSDPASTQWTAADEDLVLHLADVYEEWIRAPSASLASEARQLRDSLGLTPKGRQDRRWRTGCDPKDIPADPPRRGRADTARRARLSVVK